MPRLAVSPRCVWRNANEVPLVDFQVADFHFKVDSGMPNRERLAALAASFGPTMSR